MGAWEMLRPCLLDLIAGSRAAEEFEYKTFVTQSGFNYREHLDTVLASFQRDQAYLLLGGSAEAVRRRRIRLFYEIIQRGRNRDRTVRRWSAI